MGILVDDEQHIPDPLDKGFLGYIRRSWNNVVSNTGKLFTNGIGKATMSGVGKGLLFSIGGIIAGGLIMGALSGHAQMPTPIFGDVGGKVSADLVSGMVNGAYQGMIYAVTNPTGIGIILGSMIVGLASDVRSAAQEKEVSEAAKRVAASKGRGNDGPDLGPSAQPSKTPSPDIGPTQGGAAIDPEEARFQAPWSMGSGWAERGGNRFDSGRSR